MRFGYALRQAEVRFLADASVGIFVPSCFDVELSRLELEKAVARSALPDAQRPPSAPEAKGTSTPSAARAAPRDAAPSYARSWRAASLPTGQSPADSDAQAAREAFDGAFRRLRRHDLRKPNLQTYLRWLRELGPRDILSWYVPSEPATVCAIRTQVAAVWGSKPQDVSVSVTSCDVLEALVLGACLRDMESEAERKMSRYLAQEESSDRVV